MGTASMTVFLPFALTEIYSFYDYLSSTHEVMGIGAMNQTGYSLKYSIENFLDLGHFQASLSPKNTT